MITEAGTLEIVMTVGTASKIAMVQAVAPVGLVVMANKVKPPNQVNRVFMVVYHLR